MRNLICLALIPLAACTTPNMSFNKTMYASWRTYEEAQSEFLVSARKPESDRKVIMKVNAVNQRPEVSDAIRYTRAYYVCGGTTAGKIGAIDCATFDFRKATATEKLKALRTVIAAFTAGK